VSKVAAATERGWLGFETRITRMVTNLLAMESIGLGQFVRIGEIRVVAPAWESP